MWRTFTKKLKEWFGASEEDQSLDSFQFEGLVRNQVPFLLIDLRSSAAPPPPAVKSLIHQAVTLAPNQVEAYLAEKKIPEMHPIVLICRRGRSSKALARRLRKKSWINVYSLAGGMEQLEKTFKP
jgi:rhodanese-related sulfurtransferase